MSCAFAHMPERYTAGHTTPSPQLHESMRVDFTCSSEGSGVPIPPSVSTCTWVYARERIRIHRDAGSDMRAGGWEHAVCTVRVPHLLPPSRAPATPDSIPSQCIPPCASAAVAARITLAPPGSLTLARVSHMCVCARHVHTCMAGVHVCSAATLIATSRE